MAKICVLRNLGDGTGKQYVPINEVPNVDRDEPVFVGNFSGVQERHGPSGSHLRTVCTPLGTPEQMTLCAAIAKHAGSTGATCGRAAAC